VNFAVSGPPKPNEAISSGLESDLRENLRTPMTDHDLSEEIEERFQALETKSVHQEYTVEQLNSVVTRQQDQIDLLTAEIKRIRVLLSEGHERTIEAGEEPPPPHY
jgi:SlyX protein